MRVVIKYNPCRKSAAPAFWLCFSFTVTPHAWPETENRVQPMTKWLISGGYYWPVHSRKVCLISTALGNHSVLDSKAVLHCSPLWLPVPFVTAACIAHSRWSSYHTAIFHISHIRSPYLSSSAWARHAKLIQAPCTCAEFTEQRSQWCEIHIDFICYSVYARNSIDLIPFPITREITWKYTLLTNEKVGLLTSPRTWNCSAYRN